MRTICRQRNHRLISLPGGPTARRKGWVRRAVLGALLVCLGTPLQATIPPAPGQHFPESYVRFQQENPELFQIRGGWSRKTEAARTRRNLLRRTGQLDQLMEGGQPSLLEQVAVTGTVSIPVVPVQFTPSVPTTPPTASRIGEILFTGPNPPHGTVADYYDEVSYGLLTVTGTVFGYTTLPSADTVYEDGANGLASAVGTANRTGRLMKDALDQLDTTADFSQFDNDGPDGIPNSGDDDGVVDLISFITPESGGECGNSNIWSHRWTYTGWFGSAYTTDDPAAGGGFIQIDDYNIQAGLDCAGNEMDIGTFAHETGHIFGIPDLYDTKMTSPSQGVGFWSLMAGGSWNTPESPAHMSAWEKSDLGWLVPTLLTSPQNGVTLDQVETNPAAYEIDVGNGEYFLVENRQAVGFDQFLKTCGLAIWHVDQGVISAKTPANDVNRFQSCGMFVETAGQHYGLALEQADGSCDLEANVNRGDGGDLFPGSSNNTSFTPMSNPSSDGYDGGTGIEVTNISACGDPMSADIDAFPVSTSTVPLDVVFLIDNTGSYTDDWPNIQAQIPSILAELSSTFPDIRYGLALFRDFPFSPFGSVGDFAYEVEQPLTSSQTDFINAFNATASPAGGNDLPEAQYEAVFQTLTGTGRDLFGDGVAGNQTGEITPSPIGWSTGRHRVIYLLTDAEFHDADTEAYPTSTSDVPTPSLEAAGRSTVRNEIQSLMTAGTGLTIFTIVANYPGAFISQGQDGTPAPASSSTFEQQTQELANLTGGGVFFAGPASSDLSSVVDVSVDVLINKPLPVDHESVLEVPTLSDVGIAALIILLSLQGLWLLRRIGTPGA